MNWLSHLGAALLLAVPSLAASPRETYRHVTTFEIDQPYLLKQSSTLAFSPDGQYLACGWMLVHVPTCRNLGAVDVVSVIADESTRLAFAPDSKSVLLNSAPLTTWTLPTGGATAKLMPPSAESDLVKYANTLLGKGRLRAGLSGNQSLVFLAGGKQAVTVQKNRVTLRDAQTGEPDAEAEVGMDGAVALPCLEGSHVLLWRPNGLTEPLALWDMKRIRAEKLPESGKRDGASRAISLSGNGALLAETTSSGGSSGKVRIWDLKARKQQILKTTAPTQSAAFMPSGKAIAVGTIGGGVEVYDVERNSLIAVVAPASVKAPEGTNVTGVAVSADGNHIAAYSSRGLFLYSKTLAPLSTDEESPYFPTSAGARWVYRAGGANSARVIGMISSGVVTRGNERCARMETCLPADLKTPLPIWVSKPRIDYFMVTESGVQRRGFKWGDNSGSGEVWYSPGITLLGSPPTEQTAWAVSSAAMGRNHGEDRVTAKFRLRADEVQVPAGRFDSILAEASRFVTERKDKESVTSHESWYTKGIGLVKRIEGNSELDLIEYLPAPKGDQERPALPARSVWNGETRDGKRTFPTTLFVLQSEGGRVSGECWMATPDGMGKFTFSGKVDGNAVSCVSRVKEGRGLTAGSDTGSVVGNLYSGTWKAGAAGGTFSYTLQQ